MLFWSVIRQDFRQHALLFFPTERRGARLIDGLKILMLPSLQCLLLHRMAHLLHELGAQFIAKLLVAINATLYKAYISPCSQIGAGTIIPHTVGIYFDGTCGERVMLAAHITVCATTPRIAYCKLAADCPIIGNDVWVGAKAVIVGNVKVGDGAFIGATVVVNRDVHAGARLTQRPSRHSINRRFSDSA